MAIHTNEAFGQASRPLAFNPLSGKREAKLIEKALDCRAKNLDVETSLWLIFSIPTTKMEEGFGRDYFESGSPSVMSGFEKTKRLREVRGAWLEEVYNNAEGDTR